MISMRFMISGFDCIEVLLGVKALPTVDKLRCTVGGGSLHVFRELVTSSANMADAQSCLAGVCFSGSKNSNEDSHRNRNSLVGSRN